MTDKTNTLLEGLVENDITSMLTKWNDIVTVRKELDTAEDIVKTKIKIWMKEKSWDRYSDPESKISITISKVITQNIDKEKLKLMLTEHQLAQVTITKSSERMMILTPENRDRIKKFLK